MAAAKSSAGGRERAFLSRALNAPSLATAVERLGERARAESWTHEEFLAACRQREVAARDAHGGEGRIRAARFPVSHLAIGLGLRACQAASWRHGCAMLRASRSGGTTPHLGSYYEWFHDMRSGQYPPARGA